MLRPSTSTSILTLLALAAMATATPLNPSPNHDPKTLQARATNTCSRDGEKVYDVCDTYYSYLRCRGTRAMMAFDCATLPDHYCQIRDDRGSCSGAVPPSMGGGNGTGSWPHHHWGPRPHHG
ncbi:hypothetical protein F4808DRAFT_459874 [Astrocystis sublimbata]|nr:hypothetical protein F4808DRAFT_459874 [Astrocystis sublimbata]